MALRAVVIGIDDYEGGIPRLFTATNDAIAVKTLLETRHRYQVDLRLDREATTEGIRRLLRDELPATLQPDDRCLVYFAGHGIALDDETGQMHGYLIAQDAEHDDPTRFLPMLEVRRWLEALPCRHLLVILDCCFAGAFRWAVVRQVRRAPRMFRERYERFLRDPAQQVLTSAAHHQRALDVLDGFSSGERDSGGRRNSPFCQALLDGLAGAADAAQGGEAPDGVVSATELYLYLRQRLEPATDERNMRQTPGLWPLGGHGIGEYIFLVDGLEPKLPSAESLSAQTNPYRGLRPFEREHGALFFGRDEVTAALAAKVSSQPWTVVLGPSGSGKSSLVKAGVVPELLEPGPERGAAAGGEAGAGTVIEQGPEARAAAGETEAWMLIGPILCPGAKPMASLASITSLPAGGSFAERVSIACRSGTSRPLLLVVDQLEELVTVCQDEEERWGFLRALIDAQEAAAGRLHIVLTLRSEFEGRFTGAPGGETWRAVMLERWSAGRYFVPPMDRSALREAIIGPAEVKVLYFEPPGLVETLLD
jgi:hypothetical protein